MSIVSLSLAKAHLNIDGTADDELISLYIDAAEAQLSNHIGKPLADIDPLPGDLKLAVLKLVAFHYEQREAVGFGVTMQLAPYSVMSIADAYRESWFGEAVTDGV
ncbi:head-tail connector protein [Mesorhizobium sp. KR1-2]|uniref:head-tail connector protein n=1 Tax=Mesorhizobium sp. KR1-2 TaxID=3156609 RepID=UPI0032B438E9